MSDYQFISVYRSTRKADTYVFVRRGQAWDELPEEFRHLFGQPVHAMDLLLKPERQLARVTGRDVLDAIADKDFYLQLPEEHENFVPEFGRQLGD
ncbi:hypothetical protein CF392_02460 [Tamilnaduibacter salinus]|uniref:YcgL domain-containing protein CF392_02460 n=1 Tax=Tamilnaduibacter salinus TaxID=1484056 RepID=A0A2A2I7B9_9GAMM|nr:YcgL domain-containing protein [Tamilnaduibacter salinus]PAV27020.1 hypothetical protein CF392_02460 [Tamilnaduibacter salinus]